MTNKIEMPEKVKTFINNDIGLFINNEYVSSKSGDSFEVYNPADDTIITRVAEAGTEDIDYAVQCAEKAFKG